MPLPPTELRLYGTDASTFVYHRSSYFLLYNLKVTRKWDKLKQFPQP